MELLDDIGMKLRNLRAEKDVTLEEVATAIGTSRSLLSKYERGQTEPGLRALKKLADYYDVTLDYLFGFTSDKKPVISAEDINDLFESLDEKRKAEAVQFMRFLKNKEE